MNFTIESNGGVAARARIGNHELVFDQAPPYGADTGPSPLDVMAVSVAACAHYYAAAFLSARKLSTDGLRVSVEAEKAKEGRRRLADIKIHVELPASLPAEMLPRVEAAVLSCPAWGTLQELPRTEMKLSRAGD